MWSQNKKIKSIMSDGFNHLEQELYEPRSHFTWETFLGYSYKELAKWDCKEVEAKKTYMTERLMKQLDRKYL